MADDPAPADPPDPPVHPPPFTPEDAGYAAIVSEYLGLQRGGADPLGAALITAAHLTFMGMANGAQQQPGGTG